MGKVKERERGTKREKKGKTGAGGDGGGDITFV